MLGDAQPCKHYMHHLLDNGSFLTYTHNTPIILIIYILSSSSQQSGLGALFKVSNNSFSRTFDKVMILRHVRHISIGNGDQVKRRIASLHEAEGSLRSGKQLISHQQPNFGWVLEF